MPEGSGGGATLSVSWGVPGEYRDPVHYEHAARDAVTLLTRALPPQCSMDDAEAGYGYTVRFSSPTDAVTFDVLMSILHAHAPRPSAEPEPVPLYHWLGAESEAF